MLDIKQLLGYEGKNVVVTGAAGGMGGKAAELLVSLGAKVYAVINNKMPSISVEKIIKCDLSRKEEIEELPAQLPEKIYALYVCHGIPCNPGDELLGQVINFLAMRHLSELLLPRIETGGVIANIASIGGLGWNNVYLKECQEIMMLSYDEAIEWYKEHPDVIASAYSFSKACQLAYVKYNATREDYLGRSVRLFALAAGSTFTEMTNHFIKMMAESADGALDKGREILESILFDSMNGHGRWSGPEEQGWPLVLLGSKIFSYFSGHIVINDNTSELFSELEQLYEAAK
jgi:NAD(P)-dependent dehydrogenase (short-subunit alcohol dehydrogenase family)